MASWTLTYDGTTQSLEAWGADASSTLTLQNQTAGVLTLHFPGLMDADVPFAYKGAVILKLDDEIVFRGVAMEPERSGEENTEGITMQFVDAWWYLTQGTLTQTIFDASAGATSRTGTLTNGSADVAVADTSALLVGMTVAGTGVPAGATITAIGTGVITLSAAATASGDELLRFLGGKVTTLYALFASFSIGTGVQRTSISQTLEGIIALCNEHHGGGVMQFGACHGDAFDLQPQPVDIQGTFETGLRAALGFVPDTVPVWDYTTEPPTISFYRRAAAPAQTLDHADGSVMISEEIRDRKDLLITGVRIIYHRYLVDGTPAVTIDAAGDSSGPGMLQAEMRLYPPGSVPKYVPAVVENQWLKSDPVIIDDENWWFKNADLGVAKKEDIVLSTIAGDQSIGLDPDAPENDGITGDDLNDVSGCTKRIVEGSIPAWLSDTAHLRYIRVKGYLQLTFWIDPADPSKGKAAVIQRRIALNFAATDLGTNNYENTVVDARWEGGTFDPEPPPSGVAAAILAAQGVLQYQGAIMLTDDECALAHVPGEVINLTGAAQAAWAAMNAQVQSVTHQLHAGTTTLSFGPAEHLAPQDYLEIMRRLMRLAPSLNLDDRADSTSEAGGSSDAIHHPATQIRLGITQSDNVFEKKDVDSAGSIARTTASGKQVWSDGTTTITVNASGQVFSMINGTKQVIIDMNVLPDDAVAQFRLATFCEGGVSKSAYVLMTEPA